MNIEVLRATELYQQAGAYYVRIQAMARQHNISLREEFDEKDTPDTRYIVLLNNDFPVATCRLYEKDSRTLQVGRVVVLEEYRNMGLGRRVVEEAEKWAKDLGCNHTFVESRDVAVGFYEKLGYKIMNPEPKQSGPFMCIDMKKHL